MLKIHFLDFFNLYLTNLINSNLINSNLINLINLNFINLMNFISIIQIFLIKYLEVIIF